jgi:hypothetical protein
MVAMTADGDMWRMVLADSYRITDQPGADLRAAIGVSQRSVMRAVEQS